MNQPEDRKIIVDEDWKTQVQEERERLKRRDPQVGSAADAANAEDTEDLQFPPASLPLLITSIATQAMMALGQIADPHTGHPVRQPNLARHHIDTLAVLQEKTRGNLTAEEDALLEDALHQLRMAFVVGPTLSEQAK